MPENEAFLDSGFGAHKSYVLGLARNCPLCSSFADSCFLPEVVNPFD
jgi:hypothetical protein